MSQVDEIRNIIKDKRTSTETLHKLLSTCNGVLSENAQVMSVLERTGADGWTYDVWRECVSIGEHPASALQISKAQWDKIFPPARDQLRAEFVSTLMEARQIFTGLRSEIETELARRAPKCA
jgi:hypothetical protein